MTTFTKRLGLNAFLVFMVLLMSTVWAHAQTITTSVGAQSAAVTYGTAGSPTYTITINLSGGVKQTDYTVALATASLPAGVTHSLQSTLTLNTGSNTSASGTATLTLNAPATITANAYTFTVTATPSAPSTWAASPASGNGTLTISKKSLTASVTANNKDYDGSPSAVIASYNVTGKVGSDDVNATGGTAAFATKDAGTNKTVNAASLTLSGSAAGNYTLSSTSAATTATINQRPVTPRFTASDKGYDGSNSATIASRSLDNVVSGESTTISGGTATFDTKDVANGKTVSGSGFTLSGGSQANPSTNYILSTTSATTTAAITTRAITATAAAKSKFYGAADPELTYTITSGTLVSGENLTGTLNRASGENVATYAIQQNTLSAGSNYALTYVGANLSITAKSLTASVTANNKDYDGSTSAVIASYSVAGKVGSDDVNATGGTAAFATKDAGTNKTVNATGLTLTGTAAGNYTLSSTSAATTATINQRPVTPRFMASDKGYDGSNSATIASRSLDNVVSGESTTISGGTATFDTKDVANGKTVSGSGFTLSGGSSQNPSSNYILSTTSATTTAAITARAITATAAAKSKVYGAADPELTYTITSGTLVSGENLTGALNRASGENVATYAIQQNTLSAGSNYALTYVGANLSIAAKSLTPSVTVADKEYDQTTTATITGRQLTGQVPGDDVSLVGGTAVFGTAAAGTNKAVTVTGLTVAGSASGNYSLSSVSPTPTATINPKPLGLTGVTANNKVYDALTGAVINTSGATLTGVISPDRVSVSTLKASGSFANKNAGFGKTVNITGLSLSGQESANYILLSENATTSADITAKAVTISGSAAVGKVYDGSLVTTINTSSSTLTGVITGDVVTINSTSAVGTFANKNVGPNKSVVVSGIALAGADGGNYSVTQPAGLTASITTKGITGSFTASDKNYDGGTAATVLSRSINGAVENDVVSLGGGTAAFANANVGTEKTVTVSGMLLAGTDATNYTLSSVSTATAAINAKAVTATVDAKSKTYGSADPAFTYKVTDLVGQDELSGTLSRVSGENVGAYAITGTLTNSNYAVAVTPADLTINAKAITATVDAKSKTYGSADPGFTYEATGLVGQDELSGTLSRVSGENVGAYAISGTLTNSNYNVTVTPADLTINAKAVTATVDAKSKTYGSADPSFTYKVIGLEGTDALSGTLSRVSGENVGAYAISGTLTNSNYNVTVTPADLTINAKAVTATVDAKSKTYGSADPAFTYKVTDLVGQDELSGTLSRVSGENVGAYGITGTLTNSNYAVAVTPADLTINAKAITATVDAKSKTYGSADPGFTYEATGLVGQDELSGTLSRVSGENVGAYAISGTLTNSNYNVTVTPADLTINAKAVTATVDAKSKTYGSADPSFTYKVIGLEGTDALSGTLSRVSGENVGAYAISGTLTNSNYNVTVTPADLTINAKAVTATVDAKSKTYGSADPAFTYKVTDLVGQDELLGTLSRVSGENVGAYGITGTLTNSNYAVAVTPADLTINAKAITATVDAKSKTYGSADPGFTYEATGLVGQDELSGTLSRVSGENVGAYAISGTLTNSNYNVTVTPADLTINAKAVTATVDAKSKTYGSADPSFTYKVIGLEGTDALSGTLSRVSGENVGSYAISGTLTNGNYAVTVTPADLTINAKAVTATVDAKSKTYGSADPGFTYQATGLVGQDELSGTLSRVSGENVGSYAISGTLTNGNYAVTVTPADLTINAKAITATVDAKSKTYGSADPGFTYLATGLVGQDELSGTLLRVSGENVGTYAISGTLTNSNYAVTVTPADLTINAKAITATVDAKSKTYGSADPGFTYLATGLVGQDELSGTLSRVSGENVGSYAISGKLTNSNYVVTVAPADLTINAKAITATVDAKSKTYGSADPAFTYEATDLVGQDKLAGTLSRVSGENVGVYAISGTLTNGNYAVTVTSADLTINAKAVTATVDAKSKTYGSADPSFTYKVIGLEGADDLSGTLSRVSGENVGAYAISGTLTNSNYNVTVTPANLSITARAITVTADPQTKTYGQEDPALTYKVTSGSVVAGDNFSGKLLRDPGTNVGEYAIRQGDLSLGSNYNMSYVGANLTVLRQNAKPEGQYYYTGQTFYWTSGSKSSTTTLTLAATLKNTLPFHGDIRTAKATFVIRSADGKSWTPIKGAENLSVGLVNQNDITTGTAATTIQYSIGSATAATIEIGVIIGGNYVANDPITDVSVMIAVPTSGGQIMGGALVSNDAVNGTPASAGYVKGTEGTVSNTTFNVTYTKTGSNPKGNVLIKFESKNRADGSVDPLGLTHYYRVKSSAISVLSVDQTTGKAQFTSKGNIAEVINGVESSIEGNINIVIDVTDNCDGTDKVAMTVYRAKGGIWFSNSWDGSKTVQKDLASGSNVAVKLCPSVTSTTQSTMSISNQAVAIIPQEFLSNTLTASAYPNPTRNQFSLKLSSSNTKDAIQMRVINEIGKVVEVRNGLVPGQTIQLGASYQPGLYFIEVIQGAERKQLKLIKAQN